MHPRMRPTRTLPYSRYLIVAELQWVVPSDCGSLAHILGICLLLQVAASLSKHVWHCDGPSAVKQKQQHNYYYKSNKRFIVYLSYRQECFSGKETTGEVLAKLLPGLEWRIFHILASPQIHILISEDINDVISRFYTVGCAKILLSM